eukprot:8449826-Lingulodinium_polyedra.AAC.1
MARRRTAPSWSVLVELWLMANWPELVTKGEAGGRGLGAAKRRMEAPRVEELMQKVYCVSEERDGRR